ncbi:MAG: FGGY-family carbohydrate kinase [Oscillospiraceae bacterium]|nr:FGGY-family carbohydrate kinase [Oscillospiraceae bacterium]
MELERTQYILAHDLGTSGNKAALFDSDGKMVASVRRSYNTDYSKPGWVEQDPSDWWNAICETTLGLLETGVVKPGQISCVVPCGHMMGCVLTGKDGEALRPAIIWADTRAGKQEQELVASVGMEDGYKITGHRMSASYTAAKLLWVKHNEPSVYNAAERVLNAKDYIIHRLTGNYVTDYSDASGTNLFDLGAMRWSDAIVNAVGIKPSLLPELHASTDIVGILSREAAKACGLLPGTPVVAGGGDGSCASVGAGAVKAGDVYGILGSSSWISSVATAPLYDPKFRVFNWSHLDSRLYSPCGTMQAAGVSAQWFADNLTDGASVSRVNELAAGSPPGANGLLYLPYLLGERSPRWDIDARGAFIGLSATSNREDMARALIEGVGMNLRLIIECLGIAPDSMITMIGGGAESDLWMGVFSDIWRRGVMLPEHLSEATSLGAALAGGIAVGIYSGFNEITKMNPPRRLLFPHMERSELYDRLMPAFEAAYEGLRSVNAILAPMRH